MISILAPGQGSQTPGFLRPWLDLPQVRVDIGHASEVVQLDLVRLGCVATAAELRDTACAQPVVVAAGLACWRAVQAELGGAWPTGCVVAGHSVGEITAAAVAGVLDVDQALWLARERGRAMAAAAAAAPTGMSAVVGGDLAQVLTALSRHGLAAANRNGGDQIVAAGAAEALQALAENPPPGARVLPLRVAGAFHTAYMSSAVPALRVLVQELDVRDPACRLLSNADGDEVSGGRAMIDLIVRRGLPGVETVPVRGPADLDKVRDLVLRVGTGC